MRLARTVGDRWTAAMATSVLGRSELQRGDCEQAARRIEEAIG
jgi:hypothetical protein